MMCRCCRNAATVKRCALLGGARASRMAGVQNSARHRPLHPVHPQCSSHSAAHFPAISVVKSANSTCFEYIRVYGSTLELFHVASTVIIVSSYRSSLPQETSYSARKHPIARLCQTFQVVELSLASQSTSRSSAL